MYCFVSKKTRRLGLFRLFYYLQICTGKKTINVRSIFFKGRKDSKMEGSWRDGAKDWLLAVNGVKRAFFFKLNPGMVAIVNSLIAKGRRQFWFAALVRWGERIGFMLAYIIHVRCIQGANSSTKIGEQTVFFNMYREQIKRLLLNGCVYKAAF